MARYRTRILERTIESKDIMKLFIKAYNADRYLPKANSIEDVFNSMSESKRLEIIDRYIKIKPPYKA